MGCTEMQGECVRKCDEVLGWGAQPEDSGSMAVAGDLQRFREFISPSWAGKFRDEWGV